MLTPVNSKRPSVRRATGDGRTGWDTRQFVCDSSAASGDNSQSASNKSRPASNCASVSLSSVSHVSSAVKISESNSVEQRVANTFAMSCSFISSFSRMFAAVSRAKCVIYYCLKPALVRTGCCGWQCHDLRDIDKLCRKCSAIPDARV